MGTARALENGDGPSRAPRFGEASPPKLHSSSVLDESKSSMPAPKFIPDDELDLLFDPAFIPASMHEAVGLDYHVS